MSDVNSNMFWTVVQGVQSAANSVTNFVNRHRRKFIVLGVVGGTTYVLLRLARSKFQQVQQTLQNEQKLASNKKKMQMYFHTAQRSCDQSLSHIIGGQLKVKLVELVDIPDPTQLRTLMKGSAEEKLQLWETTSQKTFTRTISALYALCLTTLLLRVEVNILGRYMYLDTHVATEQPATNTEDEEPITSETQKAYLASAEYMQRTGLQELTDYVAQKVEEELKSWPVTRKCTFEDIQTLIDNIRARIEGYTPFSSLSPSSSFADSTDSPASPASAPSPANSPTLTPSATPSLSNNYINIRTFYQFLLPPEDATRRTKPEQLNSLLNETRDVLESDQFGRVLKTCLNLGFDYLAQQLKEASFSSVTTTPTTTTTASETTPTTTSTETSTIDASTPNTSTPTPTPAITPTSTAIPIAKLLPSVKKQFDSVLAVTPAADPSNTFSMMRDTFAQSLFHLKEIEDFSYYIFTSSYDEE